MLDDLFPLLAAAHQYGDVAGGVARGKLTLDRGGEGIERTGGIIFITGGEEPGLDIPLGHGVRGSVGNLLHQAGVGGGGDAVGERRLVDHGGQGAVKGVVEPHHKRRRAPVCGLVDGVAVLFDGVAAETRGHRVGGDVAQQLGV